jgi:hypothetical protein
VSGRRRLAVWALVALASVALVLALVVGFVRRAAVDSGQFANRATVALQDDSVRSLVAEQVTDQIVLARASDLTAARPLVESVVSSVVGSRAFTGAFRAGVRDVHRALFARDEHTVTLALADVGTMVAAALEVVRPALARQIETRARVEVVRRDIGDANARLVRVADTITILAPLLLLVSVLCAAGATWLSADRRRTVVHLGAGAAIGGLVLVLAWDIARGVAVRQVGGPDARDAVSAVWGAFLGDLRTAAWLLAACGAVVAAAAASLIRPVELDAPLRRVASWIAAEPMTPALRVLRGVALIASGLICVLAWQAVARALITVLGVYLVFAGVSAILALVYRPRPEVETAVEPEARRPGRRRRWIAPVLATAVVAAAIAVFVGSGGATTEAPAAGPCNRHQVLCDRSLPEVALAATHNSMSVPLPGWYAAEQDAPIADQLRFGIHGLLFDTHYADKLSGGRLRTYFGPDAKIKQLAGEDGVSPTAVDAALRTRERLGFEGKGERGMYLCHTFCELGGTPLGDALRDVHDFLVANPGEVLVIINQDYVTPEDFVGAAKAAGLDKFAYRGPTSGRWPTLRQMIDSNQRVLFMAENHAGAAPWYHPAYEAITQETPFTFKGPERLLEPAGLAATCRENRGPSTAPLFLVNHWVSTDPIPLPSHASQVNAYEPLMARLGECQRIRHHFPNLVAINFFRRGDVLRAVDTLNGIG